MNIVRAFIEGLSWCQCHLLSPLQLHHDGALKHVNKRMRIVSVDSPRPGQSPYTCVLPEHKPVRRGREMIDLLAVEEPKPKPAKIRAVSYEAAIDQLFKRMRSSSSALTQQAVNTPRGPVPNERRRRR